MKTYLPLIIGMTLVTYIPRLFPLFFLTQKDISPKLKQFLLYIPYASLSILIARGIMTAGPDMKLATVVGVGAAGFVSYINGNLMLSVLTGVFSSYLVINIFL